MIDDVLAKRDEAVKKSAKSGWTVVPNTFNFLTSVPLDYALRLLSQLALGSVDRRSAKIMYVAFTC